MKALFLSRLLREKLLLLIFVVVGAAIWASSVNTRARAMSIAVRRASADLAEQQLWIDRQQSIQAEADAAVRNLDPSKTFNGVRLSAELSALASKAGLASNATSGGLRTERTAQFAVHTIEFNLRGVEWGALLGFYEALSERAPYVGIEEFALAADRNNPANLNATLRVSSVEIAQ